MAFTFIKQKKQNFRIAQHINSVLLYGVTYSEKFNATTIFHIEIMNSKRVSCTRQSGAGKQKILLSRGDTMYYN